MEKLRVRGGECKRRYRVDTREILRRVDMISAVLCLIDRDVRFEGLKMYD